MTSETSMTTEEEEIADFFSSFTPYKKKIEKKIQEAVKTLGMPSKLRDACEYALTIGGKRFRPIIVLLIAEALGKNEDVLEAALAVEYFHTASLIADDLPCMDNDAMRRNKPSVHIVYGEATALLASYALIAAGYEAIVKNGNLKQEERTILAIENATKNTGALGATGGQFYDMFPPDVTKEMAKEVIHKKTVSLFEISFVFGWLFGGGDPEKLEKVKNLAAHFGMAFQLADDYEDRLQDQQNNRQINFFTLFGEQQAKDLFREEVNQFIQGLNNLGITAKPLRDCLEALRKKIR